MGIFAPQPAPAGYGEHVGERLTLRPDNFRANVRQVNTLFPNVVALKTRYPELTLPIEILHDTADTTVPIDIHAREIVKIVPSVREGIGHMQHHIAPIEAVNAIARAAARSRIALGRAIAHSGRNRPRNSLMDFPFDGGISRFFADGAPDVVRDAINDAKKNRILNSDYPYTKRMGRDAYEDEIDALQIELVRLQAWARTTGERIVVVLRAAMQLAKSVQSLGSVKT